MQLELRGHLGEDVLHGAGDDPRFLLGSHDGVRFACVGDAVSKEQCGLRVGGIEHSRDEGGGGGFVECSLFGLGGENP